MKTEQVLEYGWSTFRHWLSGKTWTEKWFVYLILMRPFIDLFYFAKDISPIASPLYIAGVLTPVLALFAVSSRGAVQLSERMVDVKVLAVMFTISVVLSSLTAYNIVMYLSLALLTLTPFILVFYCIKAIKSREDLQGVLYAFVLSAIATLTVMMFEFILNPSSRALGSTAQDYTSGYYADPMTYGLYTCILVISGLRGYYGAYTKRIILLYIIASGIMLLIVSHLVSLFVFLSLLIYNLTKGRRKYNISIAFVMLVGLGFALTTDYFLEDSRDNQLARELEVMRGERPMDQAMHGRMSRWIGYMDIWERKHVLYKLVGVPYSIYEEGLGDASLWMGRAVHSDYLRILYSVGIIGLLLYLNIVRKVFFTKYQHEENELVTRSIIIAILVYSVSTLPLLTPVISYLFSIGLAVSKNDKYMNVDG